MSDYLSRNVVVALQVLGVDVEKAQDDQEASYQERHPHGNKGKTDTAAAIKKGMQSSGWHTVA